MTFTVIIEDTECKATIIGNEVTVKWQGKPYEVRYHKRSDTLFIRLPKEVGYSRNIKRDEIFHKTALCAMDK